MTVARQSILLIDEDLLQFVSEGTVASWATELTPAGEPVHYSGWAIHANQGAMGMPHPPDERRLRRMARMLLRNQKDKRRRQIEEDELVQVLMRGGWN